MLDRAKKIAAHLLEASEYDLEVADDAFNVRGSPGKKVGWSEVAWASFQPLSIPPEMQAGSLDPTGQAQIEDTRAMTRVTKFPSGERPRDVSGLGVGAGFQQGMGGVLSATVDEVLFAHPEFGMNTPSADPESMQGAPMTLSADAPANASQLTVWPNQLRIPRGQRGSVLEFLSTWDQDAGLVKIGDEILCYESLDATTGTITVAAGGWGLLGTQPQPHAAGESVVWLEHLPVTVLTGNVGAGDSQLPIASAQDFPRESGSVPSSRWRSAYSRILNF